MPEGQQQTALARWGSKKMTRKESVVFWAVVLAFLGLVIAVWGWALHGMGEERAELEDKLNAHYKESVSIGVQTVGSHTSFTFAVDGVTRPDCTASDDGYLECSDDPQPTLEDGASKN